MKTFFKIIILLFTLNFAGCWNMYNDVADDKDDEYKFFLAVTDNNDTPLSDVFFYPLDSTGTLKQVFDQKNETYPFYIAAHPTGEYLYVTINNNGTSGTGLLMYKIQDNGSLVSLGTAATGTNPYAIKVHPSGKFVYVSNQGDSTISMYQVNNDGTLTNLSTPTISSGGSGPTRIAIDPSGNYLFVVNASTPNIAAFSISSSDGTLTSVSSIGGAPTSGIKDVTVCQPGFIYITSNNGIYLYDWSVSTHIPFNTSYFILQDSNGNNGYMAIHPSGKYLYAVNSAKYYSYQINTNGSLSYLNTGANPSDVREIVVHPNGNYLYSANRGGGRLDSFIINADGTIETSVYQTINPSGGISTACGLAVIKKKIK
jgi:6-phosphogluconolactonase